MSLNRQPKKIAASLDVIPFDLPLGDVKDTPCPHCTWQLSLIQPDAELPDRLVGVCERCKHWFLIDTIPDQSEGIIVRLPEVQLIRNLSREDPSDGISLMDSGRGDEAQEPGETTNT